MISFLKNLVTNHRVGLFAAQVSGALFDLAIDAKKLDGKDFAKKCADAYGKTSAHETATMMFATSVLLLPRSAYVLPLSQQDLIVRGEKVITLWQKEGRLTADIAEPVIQLLRGLHAVRAPTKASPLTKFEAEISTWPREQATTALLLIKATLNGDRQAIDKLYPDLTAGQLRSVARVIKEMEQSR